MSRQNGASFDRIGSRCLGQVAGAMLLAVLARLPWSANAEAAQDTRQEDALGEPGNVDAPAPQPAVAQAKSPDEREQTVDSSFPARPVTGVVVGPDGKPQEGAEVYLFAAKDWAFGKLPEDWPTKLPMGAWTVERQMDHVLRKPRWRTLRRARTDAAGRFATELPPLPKGAGPRLLVFAEGLGFGYERLFSSDRFDARFGDPFDSGLCQDMEDIRLRLPEMMPVRGRLLAPDGSPAEGVIVRVRQLGKDMGDLVLCRCRLDRLQRPGASSPGPSAASRQKRRDQLRLANRYAPEFWPPAVLTDADGSFRLEGMPQGWPVYLTLEHPGFAEEALVVHTSPRELEEHREYACLPVPPTFTHTLKPARPLQGVVRAADTGKPLSGVLLQVFSVPTNAFWHGSGCVYVRTDQQGRYRLNCHQWKVYLPSLYPPPDSGYLAMRARVEEGPAGPARDIRLDRGKIIRGRVLDAETESPIRGASVVYRPSRANSSHKEHYLYQHPVLTDAEGRFALSGLSGPGYLLVETADRSYMRSADVGRMLSPRRPRPSGLTEIIVPASGTSEKEVVIRMKRGRTVTLRAIGPKGEGLPWVEAEWEANDAAHERAGHRPRRFPDGKVQIEGLDPEAATRVLLAHQPARLAAVFNVTPDTEEGPIEVRLEPTATVAGELVTPGGKPSAGYVELFTSLAPEVSQFTQESRFSDRVRLADFYVGGEQESLHANPDGRFTVKNVIPGVPIGLALGDLVRQGWLIWEEKGRVITLEPLAAGERRDLGRLTVGQPRSKPTLPDNVQKLLLLAGRIGIVPDLSEVGKDLPPKVQVLPGSPAEKAGVRSGDRITALNGRTVKRGEDVLGLWSQLDFDKGLRLSLEREGKRVEATLPAEWFQGTPRPSGQADP